MKKMEETRKNRRSSDEKEFVSIVSQNKHLTSPPFESTKKLVKNFEFSFFNFRLPVSVRENFDNLSGEIW